MNNEDFIRAREELWDELERKPETEEILERIQETFCRLIDTEDLGDTE